MKKIRIHVEFSNPNDSTEYEDLPDSWDAMSEKEQDEYLTECAVIALANVAGSSAMVVEVDENDREVES